MMCQKPDENLEVGGTNKKTQLLVIHTAYEIDESNSECLMGLTFGL